MDQFEEKDELIAQNSKRLMDLGESFSTIFMDQFTIQGAQTELTNLLNEKATEVSNLAERYNASESELAEISSAITNILETQRSSVEKLDGTFALANENTKRLAELGGSFSTMFMDQFTLTSSVSELSDTISEIESKVDIQKNSTDIVKQEINATSTLVTDTMDKFDEYISVKLTLMKNTVDENSNRLEDLGDSFSTMFMDQFTIQGSTAEIKAEIEKLKEQIGKIPSIDLEEELLLLVEQLNQTQR